MAANHGEVAPLGDRLDMAPTATAVPDFGRLRSLADLAVRLAREDLARRAEQQDDAPPANDRETKRPGEGRNPRRAQS